MRKLMTIRGWRSSTAGDGTYTSGGAGLAGIEAWQNEGRVDPCVTRNGTEHTIRGLGITWAPGQLAFHPGRDGEYGVVRWTSPTEGKIELAAGFESIAEEATTDVHVLHNGRSLFDGFINLHDAGPAAEFTKSLAVRPGDTIDCAVGFGNAFYGADTTALAVRIEAPGGQTHAAARDFSIDDNPHGPWSYGQLAPGPKPDSGTFARFSKGVTIDRIGTLSNPGSREWEDVLSDQHPYRRVPHTAEIIDDLRTLDGAGLPLFMSEYGVGSAIDLVRVVRRYEQLGKADVEDAQFYRTQRDRFLSDWHQWGMADTFARPEDYFEACLAKMAGQRLLGLNAIRSNPNCVGYSLTGTVDQGMTGEGLTTTFRDPKPGTFEALYDGLAPLRWCLFAEPVHVYRNTPVRLDAVLANEDALAPGEYPVRLEVVGPGQARVFQRSVTVAIPEPQGKPEPPLVLPVFSEEVLIDGPPGEYRFLATFEQGAAAAGRPAVFHVADPAEMPPVEPEVVFWGGDPELRAWLNEHGVRTRPFSAEAPSGREVILASRTPQAPGGAEAFTELARRIARGSSVVFLLPRGLPARRRPRRLAPVQAEGHAGRDAELGLSQRRMGEAAPDLRRPSRRRIDGPDVLSRIDPRPRLGGRGAACGSCGRGDQHVAGVFVGTAGGGSPTRGRALRAQHAGHPRPPRPAPGRRATPAQHASLRGPRRRQAGCRVAARFPRGTEGDRVLGVGPND